MKAEEMAIGEIREYRDMKVKCVEHPEERLAFSERSNPICADCALFGMESINEEMDPCEESVCVLGECVRSKRDDQKWMYFEKQ